MTLYYLDTNLATGLNDGTSWTDAWQARQTVTGLVAGDTLLCEYRCAQDDANHNGWRYDGTGALPIIFKSVDKDDSDAYRVGASFRYDGTSTKYMGANDQYWFGITFIHRGGQQRVWDCDMVMVDCNLLTEANAGQIHIGSTAFIEFHNCQLNDYVSSGSNDWVTFYQDSNVKFYNCLTAGRHDGLFGFSGGFHKNIEFHDMDIPQTYDGSVFEASDGFTGNVNTYVKFYRCTKDPIDVWYSATNLSSLENAGVGTRLENFGCADNDENSLSAEYRYEHWQPFGKSETVLTHYRTGGADDGFQANEYSQKMVCRAGMGTENLHQLYFETSIYVDTIGSAQTFTVELAHGGIGAGTSGKLREGELWIELSGPSNKVTTDSQGYSGSSKTLFGTSDLSTSTETWNGTGVGTKQMASITYTPTMKGMITIRIYFSPESVSEKIIYVCPKIEVS